MKISKRDWAQLSAYLDGELSQRDSSKLETRIEDNPDFQAALENLRTVKAVLSHTPQLSVPRNFALRRSQVESPQRRTVPARGYRLAAAALSFLFIGVVVLDIGSGVLKGGMSAALAPREEEVMLEAAADEIEEPAMFVAKEAEEEIAPEAEMEKAATAPENLESGVEGETYAMEEDATTAVEEEADRAVGADEEYYGEEPQDTQNLLSEDEETEHEEAWVAPDEEPGSVIETHEIPWMRILEITFGLGAVGFGAAAWVKRRKDRK